MKHKYAPVAASVVLGFIFWVMDGVLDHVFFYDLSLADAIILDVPAHEFYVRSAAFALVVAFGFIVSSILGKRQRAEQDARRQEAYLRTAVESLTHPFCIIDADDRRVKLANSAAKQELTSSGSRCYALIHHRDKPCDTSEHFCLLEEVKVTKKPAVAERIRVAEDGRERIFEDHGFPILDGQGRVVRMIEYSLDITERKQAETALHRRTYELGKRVKELDCLHDISNLAQGSGRPIEHVLEKTVRLIPLAWQYPRMTCARIILRGREFTTDNFRKTQWKQACDIIVRGELAGCIEVFHLDEGPDGDEGSFLREEQSLLEEIAQRVGRILEREEAENEKTELVEQLHHAQKMEAVGTLASGVAHDFNNLLTAIVGYTELARETLPDDHAAVASLDMVEQAAAQAGGVTRALLTFTHKLAAAKAPVNLTTTIHGSIRLLRRLLPASIEIIDRLPTSAPVWVNADPTQLQQVLMNLAVNARDAMPDGGQLRISLTQETVEPQAGDSAIPDASLRRAVLRVEDTGTGMSKETMARIYEPFYTTKMRGQGTGLGMSVIHGIVSDHGGRIHVDSEPGHGTCVTVSLPCSSPPAGPPPEPATVPKQKGHGEVIVVVEDDRHVRSIIVSALRANGYRVKQARDGVEALGIVRTPQPVPRLIVLDIDLPRKSGLSCLREISAIYPDLPVLAVSGGVDPALEGALRDNHCLLSKPFQMSQLTASVARMLARSPAMTGARA